MKTTIVPAQITTVEDKIAGNLNMTQIFLLLTPIFFGSIIYLLFPPRLHFALYKVIAMIFVLILFCLLAVRIKGKVFVQWLAIFYRYTNRPRIYIANKNDAYLRNVLCEVQTQKQALKQEEKAKNTQQKREFSISFPDIFKLEQFINHPKAHLKFKFAKKGKMYVSVSQVKQ